MVDEETDLSCRSVELSRGQEGLSESRPSGRQGIDGIGLAQGPRSPTRARHEFRGNKDHDLTGNHQISGESSAQMPAIFNGPASLRPALRPTQPIKMTSRCG